MLTKLLLTLSLSVVSLSAVPIAYAIEDASNHRFTLTEAYQFVAKYPGGLTWNGAPPKLTDCISTKIRYQMYLIELCLFNRAQRKIQDEIDRLEGRGRSGESLDFTDLTIDTATDIVSMGRPNWYGQIPTGFSPLEIQNAYRTYQKNVIKFSVACEYLTHA